MAQLKLDDLGISQEHGDKVCGIIGDLLRTEKTPAGLMRALEKRTDLTELEKFIVLWGAAFAIYTRPAQNQVKLRIPIQIVGMN